MILFREPNNTNLALATYTLESLRFPCLPKMQGNLSQWQVFWKMINERFSIRDLNYSFAAVVQGVCGCVSADVHAARI